MSKVRHYCITFFNEPKIEEDLKDYVRYLIYGEEICPTTGKKHWQGYVELTKPCRISMIKKIFNDNTVHCESRQGTRDQARAYCQKDGKFVELGKWISGQGHRSDLEGIVSQLKSGTKLSEVMMENPKLYCQYRNGLKDIAAEVAKKKAQEIRNVEVELIVGETGQRKTWNTYHENKGAFLINAYDMKWWDGYDGEETIIIDDYDNDVPVTKLLKLLDSYPVRLDLKGSFTYANWTKVIITSNLTVDEIHQRAKPAHRRALFRRINKINNLWESGDEEVHR